MDEVDIIVLGLLGFLLAIIIFFNVEINNQEKIYKKENKAYLNSVYEKF